MDEPGARAPLHAAGAIGSPPDEETVERMNRLATNVGAGRRFALAFADLDPESSPRSAS